MARLRCLVVDDSPRFLEAAVPMLEREGIVPVGVARTASDALARAAELQPDLILLDVGLGSESGFDLARRLGAGATSTTRVVLISTHARDEFAELVDSSPAVGFLSKSELSGSAIRELLREPKDDGAAEA